MSKIENNSINIFTVSQLKNLLNNYEKVSEIEISIPNTHIDMNFIPKTVSALKFNYVFKNSPSEIPPNIKSVYFYEYPYLVEELPNTIKQIEIYKGFNSSPDKLNDSVTFINFGLDFNQPIDNLPMSLEKIILGIKFIHSINNLPSNIKFIHIYNPLYDYQTIKKLPTSLILLQLGTNNDIDLELTHHIINNLNYISQLEKNQDSEFFGKIKYLKNYYFYKI